MHSSALIAIAIHLCFHLANSASFCDILQPLSLLLKGSPLIDELALYDVVNTPGVAADLSHISSPAVSSQLPAPSSIVLVVSRLSASPTATLRAFP